jgi:pimeloyl-ACP methyl ester carboxylesterase
VETYKTLLPRARVAIVKNAGHLVHAEKAQEFCDLVVRFAQEAA